MKLRGLTGWLDRTLRVAAFDDVSNNGVQIARTGDEVTDVAVAVDASARAVRAAAAAGAQLLVVHHGISWGGGIRRLEGGVYAVVKAAMEANLAVYACHLPLDAHPTLGNNAQLAKRLGLVKTRPAFCYHGHVIGLVGEGSGVRLAELAEASGLPFPDSALRAFTRSKRLRVGICSGGAGEFAEEAKRLGCDLYLTGEASWGDVVAAENCGQAMVCAGHYATEVFGVRAVAESMGRALRVRTVDLTEDLR